MSVANVCRQFGEFFEVFPNLADRHELETTKKKLTSLRATRGYTNPVAAKQVVFGSRISVEAFARGLVGSDMCRTDCYFKQAKLTKRPSKVQGVISEVCGEKGGTGGGCVQ